MRVGFDARHAGRGLGIGVFIQHLANALGALPDVELVWFGSPQTAPASATGVQNIAPLPYPLLDLAPGRSLAARAGVDLIHFTGNTGWARPGPVPAVVTIHDLIFMTTAVARRSLRQVVGHRYERWNAPAAIRHAARVVVPSHATSHEVVRRFSPREPPAVVPQGVETPPRGAVQQDARECPQGTIVAFSGRDPRKNLGMLLSALRSPRCPPVRLKLLAGAGVPDGFLEDAEPELKSNRIELFDYLPRAEMWKVLAQADALVYPSLDEGFGLPVVEAMAAGVPVVSGLAPVTREVGGEAIAQIDERDPAESIATALQRILTEPDERARLTEAGFARAREYSWSRCAASYRSLYAEALQ